MFLFNITFKCKAVPDFLKKIKHQCHLMAVIPSYVLSFYALICVFCHWAVKREKFVVPAFFVESSLAPKLYLNETTDFSIF